MLVQLADVDARKEGCRTQGAAGKPVPLQLPCCGCKEARDSPFRTHSEIETAAGNTLLLHLADVDARKVGCRTQGAAGRLLSLHLPCCGFKEAKNSQFRTHCGIETGQEGIQGRRGT